MRGLAPLLAESARVVIRIGGRRLQKVELRAGLLQLLTHGLGRDVQLVDDGVTTEVGKTQANVFRGSEVSRFEEHDSCFAVLTPREWPTVLTRRAGLLIRSSQSRHPLDRHRTSSGFLPRYVDHHDAAYQRAERRRLERHPTTGAS